MKNILRISAIAAIVAVASSCGASKAKQMQMSENVKVQCNPEVLTDIAGNIPVSIAVTYPEGYFAPKAEMTVTPVLVYEGGEVSGPTFKYQGDKVKNNNKIVSSEGGTVKEKMNFKFVEGMQKSHLELRSTVYYNDKAYPVQPIKVADGVNVTARLVDLDGNYQMKSDNYQEVIHETTEAQIMYDVNSANVKQSELRSESIAVLRQALKDIANDPRYTFKGTKVVSYASPEGGQKLNDKLSNQRGASAKKAYSTISKDKDANAAVEVQSIGQDWEGFQEAIEKSNIDDKHLILRVLSMYSDPEIREKEIRNMSQVYTEISKNVFPDLRRARIIAEADYQNFSDAELDELAQKAISILDEEGLMRVAANSSSKERKMDLYERAVQVFGSDRSAYNLACMALDEGKTYEAEMWLDRVKNPDGEYFNLKGICELRKGQIAEAAKYFENAGTDDAKAALGAIAIKNGDYATAANYIPQMSGSNKALALLLNGREAEAAAALSGSTAKEDYISAILAARKGDKATMQKYLDSAIAKDPSLKEKSLKDVEFVKYL